MIVKKLIEAGSSRCIMYFDELDKSCSKHGQVNEITSILIHLTDPNMNKTFQDRFFQGIDFPLDKVIFMTSYNERSKIDPILLDRFVELDIKPYNIIDKLNIVENYIIPEVKKNIGFTHPITYIKNDMKQIIQDYTNEAGVRSIKRIIELIFSKINLQNIENNYCDYNKTIDLTYDFMSNLLHDKQKIKIKQIPECDTIGLVNGLYASDNGNGGITTIQIRKNLSGEKNLSNDLNVINFTTGSMGEVMKESIKVAYNNALRYIDENKETYNIISVHELLREKFPFGFHFHTPDTSTPKDGPSAGCAFTIAFISLILNKPFNRKVAMTGEIDLLGNVTAIGGLEYKLIGAKKAGILLVLISKENNEDIEEIIKNYNDLFNENFKYVLIKNLNDAIVHSLK
jgi:ATP-dependent Lon protease